MLDLHLSYNPGVSISAKRTSNDHYEAARALVSGHVPVELTEITTKTTNYRDAVINVLANELTSESGRETVLTTLSHAVASTPDGAPDTLRIYTEFTASLACAWGETVIATRAILRNKPENASNFLKTIASALDKKMDKSMFNDLLKNSTSSAVSIWTDVERPILFP